MKEGNRPKERGTKALRVSWVGLTANAILMILKFLAGILGNSAAMTADAVNSLSDFATDIVTVAAFRIAAKPVDESHDYGHGKFETLSSVIIGLVLLGAALGIFWGGGSRVFLVLSGGSIPKPGAVALAAATVTVVAKEALYRYTVRAAKTLESNTLMAKAWDHRSDALASSGTLLAIAGAVFLGEGARILDPVAALAVGVLVLRVAIPVIWQAVNELTEASLPKRAERNLVTAILHVPGVLGAHHLRSRKIGASVAIDVHIIVKPDLSVKKGHAIATRVEEAIRGIHGPEAFVSIHVEPQTADPSKWSLDYDDGHHGMEKGPPHHDGEAPSRDQRDH